jgi:hypothetical protein
MTPNQLSALLLYLDARIDEKIEDAFGRDALSEGIRTNTLRNLMILSFGFRQDRNGNPIEREDED